MNARALRNTTALPLILMLATPGAYAAATPAEPQAAAAPPPRDSADPARDSADPARAAAPGTRTAQPATEKDIVVTGSRIVRDGYSAPTPVTVATAEDLVRSTPTNIPDGLNKLPQLLNSQSPSRSSFNFAATPIHGNTLNLRGVGPLRTLVLFDGIRVAPTTYVGTVDTNVLPNLLVERVEIVTGGASAQYGSDAVSGVVNFILKRNYKGITGVAQAGISARGDNGNQRIGLAAGEDFAGGSGHILLSAEYYNNEGMLRGDRALGRNRAAFVGSVVGTTALVGSAGNPYIRAENVRTTVGSEYGKIAAASNANNPFVNYVFNPDGSFRPFQAGLPTGNGPASTIGGDGVGIGSDVTAIAPLKTYQTFGRVSYDIANDVTAYAQGIYARSDVRYRSLTNAFYQPYPATIYKGNPYLPAVIDAALPANGSYTIQLFPTVGPKPTTLERTDYTTVTAGLEGKLAKLRWTANYTRSRSTSAVDQSGLYNTKRAFAALDAVRDPATGQITCRVLLDPDPNIRSQYAGCTPLNILAGQPELTTPAGYAYATGTSSYRAALHEDSAEASLSGSLFSLPAGPVDIAAGAAYRHDTLRLTSNSDPALLSGPTAAATAAARAAAFPGLRGIPPAALFFYTTNVGVANGSLNVKEVFGEVSIPVLSQNAPIGSVSLDGAARYTDYSTSGSVTTWKIGGAWKPIEDLRIRGTYSQDIRAPNLFELFAGQQSAVTAISDPQTGLNGQSISLLSGGNPDLKPERARTLTIGGVFSPRFVPGLSLAADFYRLRINGQINTLTAQQILNNCFNIPGAPECDLINRPNPTSVPTSIRLVPANIAFLDTKGLDLDASYRTRLGDGALSLRLFASYLFEYKTQQFSGAPALESAGISVVSSNPVGYPKWRGTLIADYSTARWGVAVTEQYIGALTVGVPNAVPIYFVDPHVSPVWYTDLTVHYDMPGYSGKMQFFVTINNLFDKAPPFIPSLTSGANISTNISLYDTVQRSGVAGVRFTF